MPLEVYLDPCTINCRKVLAGLDLIGADYKEHLVDYFKSEQKSDAYTKIVRFSQTCAGLRWAFLRHVSAHNITAPSPKSYRHKL